MTINSQLPYRIILFLLVFTAATDAAELEPPASPDEADSAMYSLEDIYQRLAEGAEGTKGSDGFEGPASGPADGVMYSLDDIMSLAPQKEDVYGADSSSVLLGQMFWGLTSEGWGPQVGTMPNVGIQNVTPTTSVVTIAAGYHDGSGVVLGDEDLVSGNIRAGITIFGVDGDSSVVNTSSGDAAAAAILAGSKAWVDGQEVTGTLAGGTPCTGTMSPEGRWCNNGNGTITDMTTGLVWYFRGNNFWGQWIKDPDTDYAYSFSNVTPMYVASHQSGLDGLSDGS